ncbi:short subunit fatty acids transporter [Paraburkholderia sp. WSM4175]|uniref:TIGR00366 family protein n=1 Tax=Paraburkholderia sp. WSM4175 TaxID=2991072 RepID=UPI003D1C69E5
MENRNSSSSANTENAVPSRRFVASLVYVFEQVMPNPFVLSIGLTLVVYLLATFFAPCASLPTMPTALHGGTFNIPGLALQMILILATGYAIADVLAVQRRQRALAAHIQTRAAPVLS